MRRRAFMSLLGGAAAAWPLEMKAQQGERMRRIGVLMAATADDPEYQPRAPPRAVAVTLLIFSTTPFGEA
jgi:hypothetical protein